MTARTSDIFFFQAEGGIRDIGVTGVQTCALPIYETAHAVVERAYDLGLRMFDTAPLYGYGMAERRVGHVLSQKPRDQLVLSTKVGRLIRRREEIGDAVDATGRGQFFGVPPLVPIFDYSADAIVRSFEESLERLGMDRVDALLIHDPDEFLDQALAEALPALLELRRSEEHTSELQSRQYLVCRLLLEKKKKQHKDKSKERKHKLCKIVTLNKCNHKSK